MGFMLMYFLKYKFIYCSLFFYAMVSQVQSQEEIQERLRKTKLVILPGPGDRRHDMQGHMVKHQHRQGDKRQCPEGRLQATVFVGFL